VIAWLESLDKRLRELDGPRWWEALGLADLLAGRGIEP
jgi:hypothetical protein